MANNKYFRQRSDIKPMIYAYERPGSEFKGLLKVGFTEIDVDARVAQQFPTKAPDGTVQYNIVYRESAMKSDGTSFTDHDVHRMLKRKGIPGVGGEWFRCTVADVQAAVVAVKNGTINIENRTATFGMRPEQKSAVEKTIHYYLSAKKDFPDRAPKFLWNAKMRFGKTFASYQLAKAMGFKRILVLTFKPAVEAAWEEDLLTHIDFEGWQFISNKSARFNKNSFDRQFELADKSRPIVCFGSFQDLLGTTELGAIKPKNEWIHGMNWDLVIFDEYHFGAWRDNTRQLFQAFNEEDHADFDVEKYKRDEVGNAYNEDFIQITTEHYLFLSGTPFRALNSGEFIEEQIYNWTYSDEQKAKDQWNSPSPNPYASLPRMVLMTYRMPESISQVAKQGEYDEFDLNLFFSADGEGEDAKFVYQDDVQKWLDLIRGGYLPTGIDELKQNQGKRPPMPFSHTELMNVLTHTVWYLPNVAACFAMANLLKQRQNVFYHDYSVIVCAGSKSGNGVEALPPVLEAMGNPLETKTITLTCGKLTTGVTVKPWTGIFMLRNLKSPETYFQAAFRVQSPWTIKTSNNGTEIMKHECYVFDFALDRALRQVADYSCQLNVDEPNPEKKVTDFIKFLPILAYDGAKMVEVDAQDVLDIASSGTSATLLARRWESTLLVNVDNMTLQRLMANERAMAALMSIEGFRSLNKDIEAIINKSENVKKAKTRAGDTATKEEKRKISEEEKEYRSLRKQIQDKLIKFATRIPIFMYLTDYRENSLKDVIIKLEPELFKKVTGLSMEDFKLLCDLNVFNASLMNDAIFKFKRYEDASLSYTGIDRHQGEDVGGWDTVLKREEYEKLFYRQQSSMK
ncbi:MAG: restriction endonuclease [Ruminococcaceae bacterium]|nr:restriction endonuclease [Oscillospiraceae bacterium]